MPAPGRLIAIAAGLCLGAALLAAALLLFGRPSVQEPDIPIEIDAMSGARVWYPATQFPQLALPDGGELTVRSVLNIRQAMRFGDYVWDEEQVPGGPLLVRVDLDRQILSVFRGGHEIGTAVIMYGADNKPTPLGLFPVLEKAEDYYSKSYDAPMPYMLRLTADGVAVHGSDVRERGATHGCIGVPTEFARKLFGQMQLGDPVVIVKSAA